VWLAALFIPSGRYQTDSDGSPIPGTFQQVAIAAGFSREGASSWCWRRSTGSMGCAMPRAVFVRHRDGWSLFGQIGIIVFIMAIGAFISVSFATQALEVAVASLAHRLRDKGWLLIASVMVLFSLLGSTMGFSVETLGLLRAVPAADGRAGLRPLVTASMIILGALVGVMASTVNPFSIGVAAGEAGVSIGDGIGLRLLLWVVLTAMAVGWVLRYAAMVRSGPEASSLLAGIETMPRRQWACHGEPPPTAASADRHAETVLVITAFAFGLMIFSVIPWSSVIGPRPAMADYYGTHEVAGAQAALVRAELVVPATGDAVHPGVGAGGLRGQDGRKGDRAADRRGRRGHAGPGHGGAAGRRCVGDHDQYADAGHHPALDGADGQRRISGVLHLR
jgi:uncharacterized ion transporter superfamily protein YfcC